MPGAHDYVLIRTHLEDRDGGTWVEGLCPFCWEPEAFPAPPEGTTVTVECPNGHPLRIVELRSAGRHVPRAQR